MDFVEELSSGRIEAVLFEGQRLAWLRSAACKELAGVTTSFGKLTSFDLLRIKGTQYSARNFPASENDHVSPQFHVGQSARLSDSELDTGMD